MSSAVPSTTLLDAPLQSLIEEDARRQLCGGKVFLCVRLACNEVASLKEPPPLFILASRLAYLPLLFNEVYEHFNSCLPPRMGQSYEIWFDCNDVALKWHYPLGVLFDILFGRDLPAPLDLTVHFRGNSSKDILPFTGIGDLQRTVMNAFRQASYMQHGSATTFMKLSKQSQTQLWDSISKGNLDSYSVVQRQLLCASLSVCKSLTVRVHLHGPPHLVLLHPAPPFDPKSGEMCTVGSFLLQAMPPLLDKSGALLEGIEVLTLGVRLTLETPLYWLFLHAAYFDQVVHLVVRVPSELLGTATVNVTDTARD